MNTTTPRRVQALGKLWATKFIATHPNWKTDNTHEDTWYSFNGYDINLYCEDGYLSVCAYPEYIEDGGTITTDISTYTYIVKKG